jgi:hypothetical protein
MRFGRCPRLARWLLLSGIAGYPLADSQAQSNWTLLGWNNLGMHCMDSDYSVFSILPPYNTIHAQLIDGNGKLVTNASGVGVSYHAISDPDGSFNATSRDKGNFLQYASNIYGVALAPDVGLPVPGPEGYAMPGTNNTPQAMTFEGGFNWFAAYGIPITPYDDAGKPNQYPMMRLVATNSAGAVLATTDIVLPVSDEMSCKLCHVSGSGPDAQPAAGWVWAADPGRDFRLNILRLHDERQATNALYSEALSAKGFSTNGLYYQVAVNKKPLLCAACHLSEALPNTGYSNIPPLTAAMHGRHAGVIDPRSSATLNSDSNRVSCYTCHPGSVTRCLRGAMGKGLLPDGTMAMQCRSCHGSMSAVGDPIRTGWLDEPNCQACHAGSATNSLGVIRFLSAFDGDVMRTNVEPRFATNPHTPLPDTSLYRFSKGHGGLQCSACHGSTHAEFPSSHANDNLSSIQHQGHPGSMSDCMACHRTQPDTITGGPHGMHPIGQTWVNEHHDAGDAALSGCKACHGGNSRGTVLSRALGDRTFTFKGQTKFFWRGMQIGCYTCHNGPNSSDTTTRGAPPVSDRTASTTSGVPVAVQLGTSAVRIVSQPYHGIVGLSGATATYTPDPTFAGADSFTFAGTNAYNESNLGTVAVVVHAGTNALPADEIPEVFALDLTISNAGLGVSTVLGRRYVAQRSDDLRSGSWSNATGNVWGHTDSVRITDPAPPSAPSQFFRAIENIDPVAPPAITADSTTNTVYDAGWNNGDTGGSGWLSGWNLTTFGSTNAGFFVGTTNQANMSLPPRAWGLWARYGSTAEATRPFAQPMKVGDKLVLRFDNNFIDGGRSVGFGLQNANGDNLFEFLFVGGGANYLVNDTLTGRATIVPWSGSGWNLTFQIVTATEYTLTCGPYQVAGRLKPFSDMSVVRFKAWNYSAGASSDFDFFLTDLAILRP